MLQKRGPYRCLKIRQDSRILCKCGSSRKLKKSTCLTLSNRHKFVFIKLASMKVEKYIVLLSVELILKFCVHNT